MKNICDMTIKEISEMSSADRLEELSITRDEAMALRIHDIPYKSYAFEVPIIPYTIEEALDDLREGRVKIIQYTKFNYRKRLMRFNQGENYFESNFLNPKEANWFKEHSSYLQMKTWKNISMYTEEPKEKKLI